MPEVYYQANIQGAGVAVANPGDWTYTAGDFQRIGEALVLTVPHDFAAPTTPTTGTPGDGRTALNTARFDSMAISGGKLTITTDTTSTAWTNVTQDAAAVARDFRFTATSDKRVVVACRMTQSAGAANFEGPFLAVHELQTLGDMGRLAWVSDGAGGYKIQSYITAGMVAATSQASGWGALDFCYSGDGITMGVWYADDDSATIPTSGWVLSQSSDSVIVPGDVLRAVIGVVGKGNNAGGMFGPFALYELPRVAAADPSAFPAIGALEPVNTWWADKFDTAAPVASVQVALPASAALSDSALQAALQAAVLFDPSTVTARARRGSAPSGSYAAIGAVTLESGPGGDLYLDLKATSDGEQPVGWRPIVIPVS